MNLIFFLLNETKLLFYLPEKAAKKSAELKVLDELSVTLQLKGGY